MSTLLDQASLIFTPNAYKAGTLYSVKPEDGVGDFDFTRATTATRVNSAGLIETVATGVPRLDYPFIDGVVQGCPSLLLEPTRSNLILTSAEGDYGNSPASETNTISPDGTNNAVIPTPDSDSDRYEYTINGGTYSTNTKLSYSWYRKRISTPIITSHIGDLRLYVLVNCTQVGNTTQIESDVNGFDRFQAIFNITDGSASGIIRAYFGQIVGAGNSSVAYFGHQLEAGSYATSYIPTSGSAVTRNEEVANGAGDASTFNDSEGVLFAEISALANDGTFRLLSVSDGSNNNTVKIGYRSTSDAIYYEIRSGGTSQAFQIYTTIDVKQFNKVAVLYQQNNFKLYINGTNVLSDVSGITPVGLNDLSFNAGGSGAGDFFGEVKEAIYFNEALTDAELENLTSWDSFIELAQGQQYIIY